MAPRLAAVPAVEEFLQARVVTVTPRMAADWLAQNSGNRAISQRTVDRYARLMAAGKWRLNGEAVKIDGAGRLLDGQHRLTACVEAKASFPSLVVEGLEEAVFDTLDAGRLRRATDILGIRGETYVALLAGTLNLLWHYERGDISWQSVPPSAVELEEILQRHPGVRESVAYIGSNELRKLFPPSKAAFCHYLFTRQDPKMAAWFFKAVQTGENLTATQAAYRFRERLIAHKARINRMTGRELIALAFKAWNYTRQDRPVRTLVWRSKGTQAEEFPQIAA